MSFKIINPGYGALIGSDFTTVYGSIFNPRNGVAFWGSNGGYYSIPQIGDGGSLFLKFDIFVPDENFSGTYLGLMRNYNYRAVFVPFNNKESEIHGVTCILNNDSYGVLSDEIGDIFELGAVNTVWAHLTVEDEYDEDGACIVKVNGKTVIDLSNTVSWAAGATQFYIAVNEKSPVSNLIISDQYIDPDENIFRVRTRDGVSPTLMDYNGSGYARTFEDPVYGNFKDWGELYQDLKVKNLYSAVGSDGTVTGMTTIVSPAFFTGIEELTPPPPTYVDTENSKACCFVGPYEGRVYYSRQNVSSDTNAVLIQDLPVTSDTTFASLNGMIVGWRIELGRV